MPSRLQFRSRPTRLPASLSRGTGARSLGLLTFAGGGGDFASNLLALGLTLNDELDFTQLVPQSQSETFLASPDQIWSTVDAIPSLTKVTEAGGGGSSPSAWMLTRPAGVYDTGVPGSGSSTGFGRLGRSYSPNLTEVGVALSFKLSANYKEHEVSEKLIFLSQFGQSFLCQLTHSVDPVTHTGGWFRCSDENIGVGYEPQDESAVTKGVWHEMELYVKKGSGNGIVKVWLDKTLRVNYPAATVLTASDITDVSLNSEMGGGGQTLPADDFRWYDHFAIYTR